MNNRPKIPLEWSSIVRGDKANQQPPKKRARCSKPMDQTSKPRCKKRIDPNEMDEDDSPVVSKNQRAPIDTILPAQSMDTAFDNILRSIGNSKGNPSIEGDELDLDSVLSRMPYKSMLNDFFSDNSIRVPDIPIVTRSYEESYMREPMHELERECAMGQRCECNVISKQDGFVGVEFRIPGAERNTTERGMCVLCHRKLVQSLFYDVVYSGVQFNGIIQKYGNICSQDDEYAREAVLVCPPNGPVRCMPYPSACHQRNRYSYSTMGDGTRCIRQHNMSSKDFCKVCIDLNLGMH